MEIKSLLEGLKRRGCRLTVIRKAVIGIFATSSLPLSVADVSAKLRAEKIRANKTTLYRELSFLRGEEIINEIDFGDGKKHYEAASLGHHHHLVCVKCGKIDDIVIERDLEREEKRSLRKKSLKSCATRWNFSDCVRTAINHKTFT